MEKDILNEMPEYFKKLPLEIQALVLEGVWQQRTEEIAKKYSLDENQTDNLMDQTILTLIGLERPENFLATIISDLGISRLLAEQIMLDLDKRVFDYAIKTIESKPESQEKTLSSEVSDILKTSDNKTEDDKPRSEMKDPNGLNHLRSMSGDIKSFETPQKEENKPEPKTWLEELKSIDSLNKQKLGSAPGNLPGAKEIGDIPQTEIKKPVSHNETHPQKEFVQRPISVPRYTADLGKEDEGEYLLKKSGIYPEHQDEEHRPVGLKSESSSDGLKPNLSYKKQSPNDFPEPKPKTENTPKETPQKYIVDPYREPLE